MIISLVIATIHRIKELENLFESLVKVKYDKQKLEVIIVDQNQDERLKKIIEEYKKYLRIKYIKSNIVGLSKNRNIGIKNSSGEIICFPDDDCQFLSDTLQNVYKEFKNNKIDVLLGRIVDENNINCIRNWSKTYKKITKYNFYLNTSSITLFKRNKKELFDEEFGVGAKYGACEDSDFLFKELKNKKKVLYSPNVILYHPSFKGKITIKKANNYGIGFGAFCKKNLCFSILILYLCSQGLFLFRMMKNYLKDKDEYDIAKSGFIGRVKGFIEYE